MVGERRFAIALALAGTAAALQPASAQELVEAVGPYNHRAAAAVFPLRVGDFHRFEIRRYDNEERDVSASYYLAMPEGRLLMTVYIYPAARVAPDERTKRCDQEFEDSKGAIEKQNDAVASLEEGAAFAVPGTNRKRRHRAAYRMSMTFDREVQPVRSEIHLYCYVGDDWLVKYRVTAPVAVKAESRVQSFIATGPWPGRSPPETLALRP